MRAPILLLLATFLCGCGGAPLDPSGGILYDPCEPIVVLPSATATQPQRDGILQAIALWRAVGVTSLTLDPEGGQQRVPVEFQPAFEMFHGIYEPSIGEVRINSTMKDRALEITIAHELGHAIGLDHVAIAERASLMNPGNSTVLPTTDDERQLRVRWSCLSPP